MGWLESNDSTPLSAAQAKRMACREELEADACLSPERIWAIKRMEGDARKAEERHLYFYPAYDELFALCQDESWVCWLLRSDGGATPLIKASSSREVECVRILLNHCHPDAQNKKGMTALMFAAQSDCLPLIWLLLPKSNPLLRCVLGKTALDYASAQEARALIAERIDSILLKAELERELPLCAGDGKERSRI